MFETSQYDLVLTKKTVANLEQLAKSVWDARERLIQGIFSEPPTISTLVWNNEASEYSGIECIPLEGKSRYTGEEDVPPIWSTLPFHMYCKIKSISGMEREKVAAALLLVASQDFGKRVVIVPTTSPGWLYGQCSYKRDSQDDEPLKFVDSLVSIVRQYIFLQLKTQDAVEAIIFDKKTKR